MPTRPQLARPRPGPGHPRPGEVDRHVAEQIRAHWLRLGLTQQQLAARAGVTYQQVNKYEVGTNRIAAGRLPVLARALEVEVGYFFEGLGGDGPSPEPVESQRLQLALGRDFLALPRAQQEAICEMVRALAAAPRPMDAAA